jgi:hypothetical protein
MNLIICFYFKQGTYQSWRLKMTLKTKNVKNLWEIIIFVMFVNLVYLVKICSVPFCWDQLSKEQINNIWRVDLAFTIFIIKINIFIFGRLNIAIGGEYVRFGIENGQFKYRTFLKVNIYNFESTFLKTKKIKQVLSKLVILRWL